MVKFGSEGASPAPAQRDPDYLTTDEPFGHLTERIMRGLKRMRKLFDRSASR